MFDTLNKTCPRCGNSFPKTLEHFYASKRYGFQSWCKTCCKIGTGWATLPKEKQSSLSRKGTFKRDHGIELSEAQLEKAYNAVACEICGKPSQPGSGRGLHLDHNHETGQVRGSLCRFCNTTLGFAKDSVEYLEAMIRYLKKYDGNQKAA